MKRTLKLCAICMIAIFGSKGTYAQYTSTPEPPTYSVASSSGATLNQIIDTMYAHADPTDTGEGGELDRIKSFKTFWQNRVVANDGSGNNMFDQYYSAVSTSASARLTAGMVGCDGKWSCIGVNDVPYQVSGYVSSVWANPADSNHILATSHGGIFKTTNGGATWQCITDNAALSGPTMNIYWMAVNPSNPNTILAGSLGGGINKTFDGGANWQQENITVPRENIRKVFYTPDSIRIYAFKGDTVFTRLSADGSPWYNITPSGVTAVWRNLQFVPSDRTHFFISSEGANTGVWETTDSMGSTWTKITNGFSDVVSGATISATGWRMMDISAPGNDTLYFIARAGAYQTGLYKWNITGGTHTITEIYDNLPGGVNPGVAMGFVVSPSNANNIYYGSDLPFQAYDRSSGFTQIGQYYGNPTHGDIRGMWLQHSTSAANGTGDRIYFATDGGVSIKPTGVSPTTSGALTTKDISGSGLNCGTFWSFATHEADAGIGGMMHDGVVTYEPTQTDKWKSMVWTGDLPAADSWGTEIDKSKPKRGWAWVWSNVLRITSPSGGREMGTLNSHVQPSTDPGYPGVAKTIASDAYGSLYCTGNDFWRKRTTDGAFINMSVIHGWGFPDRLVTHDTLYGAAIVLDPNDTTFNGYVLYNPTKEIYYRRYPAYSAAILIPDPPGSPIYYPVASIATDPNNTERVWTTHTGWWPDTSTVANFKVHYSSDHGLNWIDMSLGLPPLLSVGKIIFDEGANILYCTNDMGIYKCDMNTFNPTDTVSITPGHIRNLSVVWTCFNKGEVTGKNFPMMQATDLRINHCQGKLYAATFGRSVWATDLYPAGTIVGNSNVINTNTTWGDGNRNRYISGSITINAGATLTITAGDTVHMPKNAAIIVEIGGKLVIDRAMITNSCEGCFWSGIQVRGNTFVGQAPASNQGWLQMKNNSTIENARIAVSNCNPDPAIFYGTTGGIIQCTNSRFVNNQNAVSMFAYTNIDAFGAFRPNLSYFQNCTFLLNDEYKGNVFYAAERMQSMVNLRGVEGITFAGCNFLNRNTNSFQKGLGNGILAWNAGFNITPYCASLFYSTSGCPDMRRTRFCGFTNGINTNGYASYDPGTSIDQADFDTVTVGVNVTKITNVSTTRCNFIVGHGHGLEVFDSRFCSQNIGILTQNTEQFRIEGNEFTGIPHHSDPTWFNFGTVVANTGNAMNKVRLCTYDSLTVGVYSLGINRSTRFPSSGLQILCNTFTANTTDISIENDGGTPVDKGIYVDQGTPGGLYPNSAGNTFSGATTPDLVNTSGNYINYYKNTSPETPVRAPLTLVNIYSAGTASCSSTLLDGSRSTGMSTASVATLDRSSLTAHKELFFTYKAAFEDSLSSHAGLIDFGNTASLLSTISASTDTATLYSTLVSGSPYISETAFRHIADLMKLPHLSMYQILQQNPDVLRNAPFVDYLDNIYSFSNNELSVLDAVKGTVTTRTWLERAIGNSKSLLDDEANIIMMALKTATDTNVSISDTTGEGICWDSTNVYYMLDSNAYYRDVDSMDVWLTNIGSTWAQYERVGYHNFKGDLTTADNVFLDIANNLPPTTIDTQSHEYYQVLWDVIRGAEYDDRDIYRLNSTEIAALDTYSTPAFTYYGARAVVFGMTTSGLAYTLYLPAWIEPCLSISSSGGLPSGKIGDNNQPGEQSNSDKFQFYAYPNPTSGIVTFSYNVPDGSGDVTIVIKNIVGETVKELHTRNNAGTIKWNSDNLTSGVYLYNASNGKKVISNGKLILIK